MSQAVITKAFVEWKARQAIDNQPIVLDEFIFANVPGLDVSKPIDNAEGLPSAEHIVHRQAVSKAGAVNAGSVVYSVTMGADVGDFSFNWIGLANKATGVLAMIIHAPTQQKIKNDNGQQGNVLVRSMLMEYSGAQAATNITTPAETWQIDFTARLAGMDEAERLASKDIYGAAAFFDTGFLVAKAGQQFYVTQGVGYVGGLRAALASNENITVGVKPVKVWVDVCYQGTLTSAYQTVIKFTLADTLQNYVSNGIAHYVFALASIDAAGNITDLRPKGSLSEQAGNSAFVRKDKNFTDIANPQAALDTLGGVPKERKVNNKALNQDIALTPGDVGALPSGGTAVAANKLATARKIAGVDFDGTQDISLKPADVGALPVDGTAKAANKLATSRKIAGVDFDGTKDISITAANVGALPTAGGDVEYVNGARHFASKPGVWEGAGGFAAQYENGSAPFMVPLFSAGKGFSQYHPIVKGIAQTKDFGYGAAVSFGVLTSGNAEFPVAVISVTMDSRAGQVWSFNPVDGSFYSPGDINTGKNISAGGGVHAGGDITSGGNIISGSGAAMYERNASGLALVYSPNNPQPLPHDLSIAGNISSSEGGIYERGQRVYSPNYRPQPSDVNAIARDTCSYAGFAGGNPQSPYMRNSNNDEVVALARYDWVNTRVEDVLRWATQNFVTSITRGAQASMVMDGWLVEAPAGCVLTGGNGNEGSQIGYALYRPLQMYRNGGWVTIDG
ncbi:phage tail-collar fiber domain-containing protein [Ewingella sp. AOP9-I1-14]